MKKILPILLLSSIPAIAQKDTLTFDISGGIQLSDGNIKNHTVMANSDFFSRRGKWDFGINATYKYMVAYPYPITAESTPSKQNELYVPLHIAFQTSPDWRVLFFSEVEHSQIRKIQERFNAGIGPSKKLINNGKFYLDLSGVLMPDFFQTMSLKNTIPERDNLSLRISVRGKLVIKTENFTFTSIQLFQPALAGWFYKSPYSDVGWADNINFRSTNSIDVPINHGLSFGISLDYIYQSYLGFLSKQQDIINTGIYLSPKDTYFNFYVKYKI